MANLPVPALSLDGVRFGYGAEALWDDVTFAVEAGSIHGLYGNNGSGKTTLFNVIGGFHRPWTGSILYWGQRPRVVEPVSIHRIGRRLTRAFQVPALIDDRTVGENLLLATAGAGESLFAALPGRRRALETSEAIASTVSEFDLGGVRDQPFGVVSYGTRRLVATLVALLSGAGLVLLDEPFANLSPENTERLAARIQRAAREENRSFLIVEHTPQRLVGLVDHLHLLGRRVTSISDGAAMHDAMERFAAGWEPA